MFQEELYIAEHDKCVFSSTCFTAAMPTSQGKSIPLQSCVHEVLRCCMFVSDGVKGSGACGEAIKWVWLCKVVLCCTC